MYIVCDGGGTKTDFMLFSSKGEILAVSKGSGTNANFISPLDAANIVKNGIEECLRLAGKDIADIKIIALFIPGFKASIDIVRKHFEREDIILQGDEKSAFYAALGKPKGIALLSGTGSFAIGRDSNGNYIKAGGWGPLFGDKGSGYHIGVMCLEKLAWLYDTKTRDTILERIALEDLDLPDISLIRTAAYRPEFNRKQVASLCYTVEKAANLGDQHAANILDCAAESLSSLAQIVAKQLDENEIPIALIGGVANMGHIFTERLEKALKKVVPDSIFQLSTYSPIVGAALCVLSEYALVDIRDPEIIENLSKKGK